MGEETRRNFILASSAQALFALQSNVAFAQAPPTELDSETKETLDRIINNLKFTAAKDLSRVITIMWNVKKELSLAKIVSEAEETLSTLVRNAEEALVKDYGADNPIPREHLQIVLAGTIFVQNILFRASTDAKSGIVMITNEIIQSVKENYCSQYPYCKLTK